MLAFNASTTRRMGLRPIAIALDIAILGAFLWMKATSDPLVIWVALGGLVFIFVGERLFLPWHTDDEAADQSLSD